MIDTRERIALVTPHGIGEIGRPFGGIPILTGMDVAGAIGLGLSRLGAELLLVKYASDEDLKRSLRITWFMHVMEHGKVSQGWESKGGGKFWRLSETTLAENLGLNLCKRCRGRGEVTPFKRPQPCPQCDGSGKRYPSQRAMARGVGVEIKGFRETWQNRVDWCRYELEKQERIAVSLLRHNLRPG